MNGNALPSGPSVRISNVPTDRYMALVDQHRQMKELLERVIKHPGKNSMKILAQAQADIELMRDVADTLAKIQAPFYLAEPQPVEVIGKIMGFDFIVNENMPANEVWVQDRINARRLATIIESVHKTWVKTNTVA